jgi:hypothetical protein
VIAVLANDSPGGGPGPLVVTAVTQPAHGSAAISGGGTTVTYTSDAGHLGGDTFTYTVTDGDGSADATVTVNVVAALPPTAANDQAVTDSATPVAIPVLANDSTGGGPGPLVIESVGVPIGGEAVISGSSVNYSPRAGFLGTDSFPYTISDGLGTASATITVEVRPVTTTLWLPFDESSGSIAHDALGRPLGSLNGFATPDWVAGQSGGGLRFFNDGNADSVVLTGNKGVTGGAARTLAFWMNAAADQGSGVRPTMVSWGASNGTTAGIRFDVNLNHSNGYKFRAEFNSSGLNFTTPARSDLRGAGWVHCALVVPQNASVSQILGYLDGVLATATLEPTGAGGTAINTGTANDLTIGNWATDASRPFRGILDDLRLYPRALTAPEIAALAAQTPGQTAAAAWFFRHSGIDLPGPADWAADLDFDGFNAFLEYALGGNPTAPSRTIAPILNANLDFVFNRRQTGLPAAAYVAEFSPNLGPGSWSPLAAAGTVPHPELAGFDQVTVPLPAPTGDHGFIRLRVTGP